MIKISWSWLLVLLLPSRSLFFSFVSVLRKSDEATVVTALHSDSIVCYLILYEKVTEWKQIHRKFICLIVSPEQKNHTVTISPEQKNHSHSLAGAEESHSHCLAGAEESHSHCLARAEESHSHCQSYTFWNNYKEERWIPL